MTRCYVHFAVVSFRVVTRGLLRAKDIAERHWGLRCCGYFVTGGKDHNLYSDPENTAEFNPRTGSAVLASDQARSAAAQLINHG